MRFMYLRLLLTVRNGISTAREIDRSTFVRSQRKDPFENSYTFKIHFEILDNLNCSFSLPPEHGAVDEILLYV